MNKRVYTPLVYQMDANVVQWDASCNVLNPVIDPWHGDPGETKFEAVARAWAGAMELAADAQARFNLIKPIMDAGGNNKPREQFLLQIDAMDPGYLQFFRGSWDPRVTNEVERILNNVRNVLTFTQGSPFALRNTMDPQYAITVSCNNQDPVCAINGGIIPSAVTSQQVDTRVASTGAWINICDAFFNAPRFDKKKIGAIMQAQPAGTPGQTFPDLDYWLAARQLEKSSPNYNDATGSTDALIIFHEMTHIRYVGQTNTELQNGIYIQGALETRGWFACAQMAQTDSDSVEAYKNADTYAWYAEYGYFVRRLQSDPWPHVGPLSKPVTR
ncbi:hypothetical protein G7Y89_g11716 [Cudoniella acicularis]|uniref:Lysine-specific metallo-endopeptidase domain-containing protein n=1 Tax=Cudoniella acicularis TaxID=354080 RepID=A0A8H4W0D6_9HELO|nr:hypothetical protein G7Y89_g11716 [Cudoniella acicularis]